MKRPSDVDNNDKRLSFNVPKDRRSFVGMDTPLLLTHINYRRYAKRYSKRYAKRYTKRYTKRCAIIQFLPFYFHKTSLRVFYEVLYPL